MTKEKSPFQIDPDNTLPKLDGWISLPEAAERLGLSRQRVYRLARESYFPSLSRVGNAHFVVVRESEVEAKVESRKASQVASS